jgi:hypothetical protein
MRLRVGASQTDGEHLQIGVKFGEGIRIAGIAGEKDRWVQRFQFDLDARLLEGFLIIAWVF